MDCKTSQRNFCHFACDGIPPFVFVREFRDNMQQILIIEDSTDINALLSETLQAAGFATQSALDGFSGQKMALSGQFDLIITDIKKRKADIQRGFKEWKTSPIGIYPPYVRTATQNRFSSFYPPFLAGAAYAWDDDMLKIKIHFVDWLSSVELRIKFDQGKIALSAKENYQAKSITIGATLR